MGLLSHLLGLDKDQDPLLAAIERAVDSVEPRLKQIHGYPNEYRKPVSAALDYARSLATALPGPVMVDRKAYAMDPLVHALFPSLEFLNEILSSSRAIRDYAQSASGTDSVYALLGMRRIEKTMLGIELSGDSIQREVPQDMVYFTNHTIENPAATEIESREQIAWNFFDSLVGQVAKRIDLRKQQMVELHQQKEMLMAKLHTAEGEIRSELESQLGAILLQMQAAIDTIDLRDYLQDFELVLLEPEQHLRLDRTAMVLDDMGIRRAGVNQTKGKQVVFEDLVGYDRRRWTVTLVHFCSVPTESFTERIDSEYRKLVL